MTESDNGEATDAFVIAPGGDQVNIMQQAVYNGHYGFVGGKVQHAWKQMEFVTASLALYVGMMHGTSRIKHANHAFSVVC
jgi:hypothetical protein